MKTFEEKWTAWIDGQLEGKELAEFEATLEDRAAAEAERDEARKLSALLKTHAAAAPTMSNQEFFHHQLRQQIASDGAREADGAAAPSRRDRETWWTLGRLVWTSAASLAALTLCTFFVMRPNKYGGESSYLTQIKSARVDTNVSPDASISIFETKEDRVTVLWVEGLQSLPSEYAAK